jgi:hypothetical protein
MTTLYIRYSPQNENLNLLVQIKWLYLFIYIYIYIYKKLKNLLNQDNSDKKPVANGTVNTGSSNSALGMLGSYSDSDESE